MQEEFHVLKKQLMRIGNVKIDVSQGEKYDGLSKRDLAGIANVEYLYSRRSYYTVQEDMYYTGNYLVNVLEIKAIKKLANVVSRYIDIPNSDGEQGDEVEDDEDDDDEDDYRNAKCADCGGYHRGGDEELAHGLSGFDI